MLSQKWYRILILVAFVAIQAGCYFRTDIIDKSSNSTEKIVYANLVNFRAFKVEGNCGDKLAVKVKLGSLKKSIKCEGRKFINHLDLIDLPEGPHSFSVSADSSEGLLDHYTVFKDTVPPDMNSALLDDGISQYSKITSPLITWSNVSDLNGSGLASYEVCLSTDGLVCDLSGKVNTQLREFYQFSALFLGPDQQVSTLLKSYDKAGNSSLIKASDGFKVFRKINLGVLEDQFGNYNEGDWGGVNSWFRVTSGGEGEGNSGILINDFGSYLTGVELTDTFGEYSKSGRYVLYNQHITGYPISQYAMTLFDSQTQQSFILARNSVEQYFILFNDAETAIYFSDHQSDKCYIRRFDLVSLTNTLVVKSSDTTSCPDFRVSENDQKLVYVSNKNGSSKLYGYIINTDGTNEVKLDPPSIAAGESLDIDVKGSYIFVLADYEVNFKNEIWRFDLDGNNGLKLTGGMVAGGGIANFSFRHWEFFENSTKIAFIADKSTALFDEVWLVNTDGSSLTKLVNPSCGACDASYLTKVDETHFVVQGDLEVDNRLHENYIVQTGSVGFTRLHGANSTNPVYKSFPLNGIDSQILAQAWISGDSNYTLWVTPMNGGPAVMAPITLSPTRSVTGIARSRTSDRVAIGVWDSLALKTEMYVCKSDFSAACTVFNFTDYFEVLRLHNDDTTLDVTYYTNSRGEVIGQINLSNGNLLDPVFTPANIETEATRSFQFSKLTNGVFFENNCSVHRVDTNLTAYDLFPWKIANGCVDRITVADNDDIILLGDYETNGLSELYLSRGGNQTTKEKINSSVVASIYQYDLTEAADKLVYFASPGAGVKNLFYVDLLGTLLNPIVLTGAVVNGTSIDSYSILEPGNSFIFSGNVDHGFNKEVYKIELPSGTRTKFHPNATSSVMGLTFAEDKSKIAFFGNFGSGYEFRVANTTGSSSTVALTLGSNLTSLQFFFSPDKTKLAYLGDFFSTQYLGTFNADGSNSWNLYSLLSMSKVGKVVGWLNDDWLLVHGKVTGDDWAELYKVKFDGSQVVKLTDSNLANTIYYDFKIYRNSGKIVYYSNEGSTGQVHIFSIDINTGDKVKISSQISVKEFVSKTYNIKNGEGLLYRTVDSTMHNAKWFYVDLITGQQKDLFADLPENSEFLGRLSFDASFTKGILGIRKNFDYYLHSVSF